MTLGDGVIGTPSFIHVNVSGGEPDELQDNVISDPIVIFTGDNDDGVAVITGAAVWMG